jgi:hypothetical protein
MEAFFRVGGTNSTGNSKPTSRSQSPRSPTALGSGFGFSCRCNDDDDVIVCFLLKMNANVVFLIGIEKLFESEIIENI